MRRSSCTRPLRATYNLLEDLLVTFIKKSVFVKTTLALLMLMAALVIAPGQAQAQTAGSVSSVQAQGSVLVIPPNAVQDSRCSTNTFCLFENINFGGSRAGFISSVRNFNGHTYGNGDPLPNSASSMINNSSHTVTLTHTPNSCTGNVYTARSVSIDSTFVNNSFNDQANCVVFN